MHEHSKLNEKKESKQVNIPETMEAFCCARCADTALVVSGWTVVVSTMILSVKLPVAMICATMLCSASSLLVLEGEQSRDRDRDRQDRVLLPR